jgi:hypothetical protein
MKPKNKDSQSNKDDYQLAFVQAFLDNEKPESPFALMDRTRNGTVPKIKTSRIALQFLVINEG